MIMALNKTFSLFIAAALVPFSLTAQEEASDPVASVITSESEATAVLGGGWPPQKIAKKVGESTMKKILNGQDGKQ